MSNQSLQNTAAEPDKAWRPDMSRLGARYVRPESLEFS
jgi:hypothetical protein